MKYICKECGNINPCLIWNKEKGWQGICNKCDYKQQNCEKSEYNLNIKGIKGEIKWKSKNL